MDVSSRNRRVGLVSICNYEGSTMNINESIYRNLRDVDYDIFFLPGPVVHSFLMGSLHPDRKRAVAYEIVEHVMAPHSKGAFDTFLWELARIEEGIAALQPHHRDHVVHSVYCFLLGIWLGRWSMENGRHYSWKLASLFHDIAYPIEIACGVLSNFTTNVETTRNRLHLEDNRHRVVFQVCPSELIMLSGNISSFTLIQNRINEWGLSIDVEHEFNEGVQKGVLCHGMLGALILLKVLDDLYDHHNPGHEHRHIITRTTVGNDSSWHQSFFDNEIVDAVVAIFLHNLDLGLFSSKKISRVNAPIAYFLRLCDGLQEWERPSSRIKNGLSRRLFDCVFDEHTLTFVVNRNPDLRDKMEMETGAVLDGRELEIRIASSLPHAQRRACRKE
jgi:hypothetical protein